MPVKHEHILNPITAVAFCRDASDHPLILAGEGSFLKVFESETSKLLQQCELFKGQAIHGIALRELPSLQVVIWGGPCLLTLSKQEFAQLLDGTLSSIAERSVIASDWILDVAISSDDQYGFAMVTAHNTVLHARLGTNLATFSLEVLPSPSRSILYSAHLVWESSSSLLIAAGTVFGEIIVWKCELSGNNEVLHIFTGHEGSVFGVNISAPIHFKDNTIGRLLASCSDDRTIRVWSLLAKTVVDVPLLRETGFGNNEIESQVEDYKCLATVMAHASRIWRVKFLLKKNNSVGLLSFGEDSTAQHWSLDLGRGSDPDSPISSGSRASLNNLNTFNFHRGKHIWSTANYLDLHGTSMIVTGGADGKISMYDIDTSERIREKVHSSEPRRAGHAKFNRSDLFTRFGFSDWDLEDVIQKCSLIAAFNHHVGEPDHSEIPSEDVVIPDPVDGKPTKKKPKKIPKDTFNRYGFISQNNFLVTTTFGRVFVGNIGGTISWQEISLPDGFPNGLKSYAVVQGVPELGLAFLAGASGNIFCHQGGNLLCKVANVDSKVADMFKIFNPEMNAYELLVTTLSGEVATLLTLDTSSSSVTVSTTSRYHLPDKFVVTSAGKTNHVLILGSRSGTLILYAANAVERPVHIWTPEESSTAESITTIIAFPSLMPTADKNSYILTTSRDGSYSIFSCTFTLNRNSEIGDTTIHLVHHGTPPFGPMIESAWFSRPSNDLFLYGFKGKSFIVWNETQQFEISNIECGGAHRSYAYSPISTSSTSTSSARTHGGGNFVYTKASKLYLHTQRSASHEVIKRGGHGREIKACAVSTDGKIIATGAEDTEIRLWTYSSSPSPSPSSHSSSSSTLTSGLQCNTVVQKHTTGIQSLLFHSNYLFSSGGNEEFFIWSITSIPSFGTGIICEASVPDQSLDRDLRIMSFDVSDLPGCPGVMLISLAYSDSSFRSYSFSSGKGWEMLASGRYTSSCLTQIRHLQVAEDDFYVLTAATDGRLVLWQAPFPTTSTLPLTSPSISNPTPRSATFTLLSNLKIHQSSIKSLDITTHEALIWVATGGDDNALAISIYSSSTNNLSNPPKSFILKSAHAAAVTGLCFLPSPEKQVEARIVSSSNDQRVKEWEISLNHQVADADEDEDLSFSLRIKKTGDGFTAVADIGDLTVLSVSRAVSKVLIVGNGMEVWEGTAT